MTKDVIEVIQSELEKKLNVRALNKILDKNVCELTEHNTRIFSNIRTLSKKKVVLKYDGKTIERDISVYVTNSNNVLEIEVNKKLFELAETLKSIEESIASVSELFRCITNMVELKNFARQIPAVNSILKSCIERKNRERNENEIVKFQSYYRQVIDYLGEKAAG